MAQGPAYCPERSDSSSSTQTTWSIFELMTTESAEMARCAGCGEPGPAGAGWCSRCLQSYSHRAPVHDKRPGPVPREATIIPVYSRWRAGPVTFGLFGRLAWSAPALVMGALVARAMFNVVMQDQQEKAVALVIVFGVPILIFSALFLVRVWQRDRVR